MENIENKIEVKKDTQARDWAFTVNNPTQTEQEFFDYLKSIINVRYFIFGREKGDGTVDKEGTEHYQGYIEFTMPKKFSTMKNLFSESTIGVNAHIKKRYAKRIDNVNYIKKIGKHKDKAHTRIGDIYEFGEFVENGERTDLKDMLQMKLNGASDVEIFESYSGAYSKNSQFIDEMYFKYKAEQFARSVRKLEVNYIYGDAGVGKTRFVLDKHGYENVYIAEGFETSNWFDGYQGQDVLLLDEYRSDFKFGLLLKYLDIYPLVIRCRYRNKQACYTKVYITSNIPLSEQYLDIQLKEPKSWKALLRRITAVYNFNLSQEVPVMFGERVQTCWNNLIPVNEKAPFSN